MTEEQQAQPQDRERFMGFKWNIPNVLVLLRMALVPVLIVVFISHPHDVWWRLAAAMIFLVGIVTDFFDGYLARKNGTVSKFGKIWDSIADKALTGTGFLLLSIVGELPWWVTIIVLLREWGITAMRFVYLEYGVISANIWGKLKTFIQAIALFLFLLWFPDEPFWFAMVKWAFMTVSVALTALTGVLYLFEAHKLRVAAQKAGHEIDIEDIRDQRS